MKLYQLKYSRGFTVIELLAALSVVFILAAITMSVVIRVRESGRTSTCLGNLKQLGLAFHLYLKDYDGTFPSAIRRHPDCSAWVAMPTSFISLERPAQPEKGALYPYVRNPEVYICPSDRLGQQLRLSYAMNNKLGTYPEIVPNIRESQISDPAKVVLLVEPPFNPYYHTTAFASGGLRCFAPSHPIPCYPERICGEPYFPCGCLGQLACRHSGKSTNVLFCDAHAQTFPPGGVKIGMFFP